MAIEQTDGIVDRIIKRVCSQPGRKNRSRHQKS